jgi:hypothetical protein
MVRQSVGGADYNQSQLTFVVIRKPGNLDVRSFQEHLVQIRRQSVQLIRFVCSIN